MQDTCPSCLQNDAAASPKAPGPHSGDTSTFWGYLQGGDFSCNTPALPGSTLGCASVCLHRHTHFCGCLHTHVLSGEALGEFSSFPAGRTGSSGVGQVEHPRSVLLALGEGCWRMDRGHRFPITLVFWGAAGVQQLHIPLRRAAGLEMCWTPGTRMSWVAQCLFQVGSAPSRDITAAVGGQWWHRTGMFLFQHREQLSPAQGEGGNKFSSLNALSFRASSRLTEDEGCWAGLSSETLVSVLQEH